MSDQIPSSTGAAQTIRSLVQPEKGRALTAIGSLSDEQLRQVVLWMREGKSNELIARTILDYWGRCTNESWPELQHALYKFRERVFEAGTELTESVELLFDPLAENATLVKDLRKEFYEWNEKIKNSDGVTKEMLDHVARLGRLLADTIANHATIQVKLNKAVEGQPPKNGDKPVNIGECKIIYNQFAGTPNMADAIGNIASAFEGVARRRALPAKPKQN